MLEQQKHEMTDECKMLDNIQTIHKLSEKMWITLWIMWIRVHNSGKPYSCCTIINYM